MKKLLIVESPAKIKTISKFLGKDFKIMSTVGHIKDLPQRSIGVSLTKTDGAETIDIEYVTLEKKEKIINEILTEAAKAQEIYLAPDPDREGEIIAWHVEQELLRNHKDPKKIFRIAFNEITKPAIDDAISHPSIVDLNKVAAQQARRVLDRWVGYEVSPILWRKVSKGLSAGRVQSVALRLICDREEEIRVFKPEEYWTIDGIFISGKDKVTTALTHKNKKKIDLKTEKDSKSILADADKHSYAIASIKDTKRLKNSAAPFMTSTLQQAAYNQLGFSVDKTMMIAQKLYEGIALDDPSTPIALITYMRTDSLRIADTALKSARTYIDKSYGDDYLPSKSNVYAKGGAQDAHEAIRPIDVFMAPDHVVKHLERDAARLYELIWKRFVASQMKPAQYAQRQVLIEGGPYTFKATGSSLLFDGFLRVYNDADETDEKEKKVVIPPGIKQGEAVDLEKLLPKQHFTEPPARYTEASLVKELEKEGIGRPSTYATILKTIQARAYTTLDPKKKFIPTELGMLVIKLLVENLPQIMNTKFTATMEEDLDAIARGSKERDKVLIEFYGNFEKDVTAFAGDKTKKPVEQTSLICPRCGEGTLVVRIGKTGSFVGCSKFPACTFTSKFTRAEDGTVQLIAAEEPKLLEETCPKCGKHLRQLMGRFGPFVACSGYPECTYIQQKTASFPCPECGGKIVQKFWKGKVFWGCSSYPKCKFSISGDIVETPCPKCKAPYLVKKSNAKGDILACNNQACGYTSEMN